MPRPTRISLPIFTGLLLATSICKAEHRVFSGHCNGFQVNGVGYHKPGPCPEAVDIDVPPPESRGSGSLPTVRIHVPEADAPTLTIQLGEASQEHGNNDIMRFKVKKLDGANLKLPANASVQCDFNKSPSDGNAAQSPAPNASATFHCNIRPATPDTFGVLTFGFFAPEADIPAFRSMFVKAYDLLNPNTPFISPGSAEERADNERQAAAEAAAMAAAPPVKPILGLKLGAPFPSDLPECPEEIRRATGSGSSRNPAPQPPLCKGATEGGLVRNAGKHWLNYTLVPIMPSESVLREDFPALADLTVGSHSFYAILDAKSLLQGLTITSVLFDGDSRNNIFQMISARVGTAPETIKKNYLMSQDGLGGSETAHVSYLIWRQPNLIARVGPPEGKPMSDMISIQLFTPSLARDALGIAPPVPPKTQPPAAAPGNLSDAASEALARGDYVTARRLWEPLAEKGDAKAQVELGRLYDNSQGVPGIRRRRSNGFKKPRIKAVPPGKNNLGRLYAMGSGVAPDFAKAMALFKEADAGGFLGAKFNIGLLHKNGMGVPRNAPEGLRLIRQDAEAGLDFVQYELGKMYLSGDGAPVDSAEAKRWIERSAKQNFQPAREHWAKLQTAGPERKPAAPVGGDQPKDVDGYVMEWMNKTYGPADTTLRCWPTFVKAVKARYCMRVVSQHWDSQPTAGTRSRMYLLSAGQPLDATATALPSYAGAFIVEAMNGQLSLVSGTGFIPLGSSTSPPQNWQFIEVGTSQHGWMANYGGCQQGICVTRLALLVPNGDHVTNIGFPVGYSDTGTCIDAQCESRATELSLTFEPDPADHQPIFALKATLSGRLEGSPVSETPFPVPLDTGRGTFRFPTNAAMKKLLDVRE